MIFFIASISLPCLKRNFRFVQRIIAMNVPEK
jgi:hypothetical protein